LERGGELQSPKPLRLTTRTSKRLVERRRSRHGYEIVVEDMHESGAVFACRTLHFHLIRGDSASQAVVESAAHVCMASGSIVIGDLALDYHRAMLCALAFRSHVLQAPRRVAVLGLGGASLVNAIAYLFPSCNTIDVVEHDADVVDIATRHFGARLSPRVHIIIGDAREYIRSTQRGALLDALFVDVGSSLTVTAGLSAPPPSLTVADALRDMRSSVRVGGVVAVNVLPARQPRAVPLDDSPAAAQLASRFAREFAGSGGAACMLTISSDDNAILIGTRGTGDAPKTRSSSSDNPASLASRRRHLASTCNAIAAVRGPMDLFSPD